MKNETRLAAFSVPLVHLAIRTSGSASASILTLPAIAHKLRPKSSLISIKDVQMKSYWLIFGVCYATGVAAVFWFGNSWDSTFEANSSVVTTRDSEIAVDDIEKRDASIQLLSASDESENAPAIGTSTVASQGTDPKHGLRELETVAFAEPPDKSTEESELDLDSSEPTVPNNESSSVRE